MKTIMLRILELFAENYVGTIGKRALYSGLYRSGKEYIPLSKGERFPPHLGDEDWNLVVKV